MSCTLRYLVVCLMYPQRENDLKVESLQIRRQPKLMRLIIDSPQYAHVSCQTHHREKI